MAIVEIQNREGRKCGLCMVDTVHIVTSVKLVKVQYDLAQGSQNTNGRERLRDEVIEEGGSV